MRKTIFKNIAISVAFLSLFSLIFFKVSAKQGSSAASLNVMTFNIRYNNPGDGENAWPFRKQMVAETIRFHKVDIAGLQEALHGQLKDLEALLPEYGWFGVGRDDGRQEGEYTPVFYLISRFKILNQSTFWLSENPDKPGKGWDAACPRIATWAKVEDKLTKTIFYFFNTHLDHVGEIARIKGAELLLKKIDALAEENPVILTGDFNCTEKDPPYKTLTLGSPQYAFPSPKPTGLPYAPWLAMGTQISRGFQRVIIPWSRGMDFMPLAIGEERWPNETWQSLEGGTRSGSSSGVTSGLAGHSELSDARYLSKTKHYGATQTFNGFQDEIKPGYRIDFVFVRNIEEVLRHGIISERWDGRFVSDHNAVLAEIIATSRPKM